MSVIPQAGERLPELRAAVTAKSVIQGAVSSRDWQPQHHDKAWAVERAGLPNIILNNYTQSGWISRYVTDWCGPGGRLARMRVKMRSPICPGDEMRMTGWVRGCERAGADIDWVNIEIEIAVGDRVATNAWVRLALPVGADTTAAWRCGDAWQP